MSKVRPSLNRDITCEAVLTNLENESYECHKKEQKMLHNVEKLSAKYISYTRLVIKTHNTLVKL